MSFSKSLAEVKPRKTGLPCGIQVAMTNMTNEEKDLLNDVLFDESRAISNPVLQQILMKEGYPVSYSSVSQHRRKQCRCFASPSVMRSADLYV